MFEEIFILQSYKYHQCDGEDLIVDAGANIGMAVLCFKLVNSSCRIICFEPHSESFGLLQLNVTQNNLQNVVIHNIALANTKGKGLLYGNRLFSLNMSLHEDQGDYTKEFQQPVSTDCLSSFIESEVTLLKIDVEGSEQEIVQDIVTSGKVALLQKIIIEFHPRPNANMMDLKNQLVSMGFKFRTWTRREKKKRHYLYFLKSSVSQKYHRTS